MKGVGGMGELSVGKIEGGGEETWTPIGSWDRT
jgi:hypothetical protein